MKRFIVLDVGPNNGDYSGFDGSACAVVEMTPELAKLILKRAEAFKKAKAELKDEEWGGLWEMYFWDRHATYYDDLDADEGPLAQELLDALDQSYLEFAKDPFEKAEYANTEVEQMIIRADEVAFICMPKHSEAYANTVPIPLSEIEKYAKED